MRRRAEALVPVLALLAFLAISAAVNLLLDDAQGRGVEALEASVEGEVQAIAASQDQRLLNTFSATSGLSNPEEPWELEVGSAADLAQLEGLLALVGPTIRSGFYLIDADSTITQGVQFTGDPLGEPFGWPGYEELIATESFARGIGGVLPVSDGLTTDEPVLAYVIPILDPATFQRRGGFVFESVVAADSDFNKEIGALRRGDTGEYLFFDDTAAVIASNDPSLLARRLTDGRLRSASAGVHRFGDQIVVLADVPSAGWRVAFRQDADEFDEALAQPLQTAGRVLVLVLVLAGAVLTVVLHRRLRASRLEQARLEAINNAQQEFVSIVSHELRTPVAGVLGFLETSIDHWSTMSDADRLTAVQRAAGNARRLQALTRDVLDAESIESGRLVHVFERVDLGGVVQSAVTAAREVEDDRAIELDVPADPVWVRGDGDRLRQVLANLVDNACKSSPTVEPVSITLAVDGAHAMVSVSDRGAGIPAESLERIFDKFVRGGREQVTGTGLGLYISRQIVAAHGGRIWAESQPGAGATFRFVVPLASTDAEVVNT